MRYIASYLLLALGGETDITSEKMKKVLSSVGIESDSDKLNKIISELKGKSITEVMIRRNKNNLKQTYDKIQ